MLIGLSLCRCGGIYRHWREWTARVNQPPADNLQSLDYAFDCFLADQRAFINADNFFLAAALIEGRPLAFLETATLFLGPDLPLCLAHQAFLAAAILARAAALIRRRFGLLAGLAWLPFGGRPRRAGWAPSPASAAIACSRRPASCLSCATML